MPTEISVMASHLRKTINAIVRPGEESGYVADCFEIAVVTQGATLDETIANLNEAVELHLRDEDLAELGIAADWTVIATMELSPEHA